MQNEKKTTNTPKAPTVTLETPVSVRIGSDQYMGKVISLTACSVRVAYGRNDSSIERRVHGELIFRPSRGAWRCPHGHRLVLDECETHLDPCF
jgi:hypothetical protein